MKKQYLNFRTESDKVILITYQSLELLVDIIKKCDIVINLICFDEARHITSNNIGKFLFGTSRDNIDIDRDEKYDDSFIKINVDKKLYFTATPKNANGVKMYEKQQDITLNGENYNVVDNEDNEYDNNIEETNCEPLVFDYMHKDGVTDGILNDFNIRVDLYIDKTDKSIFEAISRSILETGNNRVLTFHSRSETKSDRGSNVLSFSDSKNKSEFIKSFNSVVEKEFPHLKDKYKSIEFKGVTTNTKNRIEILDNFYKTPNDKIYILASCKTMGEGIDTKKANMVVFVDSKQSHTEIIQNIRKFRKDSETTGLATVLLPVYVDLNAYKDCKTLEEKDKVIRMGMSKNGDYSSILNVLSALKDEDFYMFEMSMKSPNNYTEKEINDNLKKNGLASDDKIYSMRELFKEYNVKYYEEKSERRNFKRLSRKIGKNIQVINDKVDEDDIYINRKFKDTLYFVKKDNGYIKTKGKSNSKINKPNRNVKPTVHAHNDIKVLWEISSKIDLDKKIFGGFITAVVIKENVQNWMDMLEKLKGYINEHKKRPSEVDDNIEIVRLARWIHTNRQCYKQNKCIMKNKNNRILWEKFLLDYAEYFPSNGERWTNMLIKLDEYINVHQKLPTRHHKNINIKILGGWTKEQKRNYIKKSKIMMDDKIKEKWEQFVSKHKIHFLNSNEKWHYTLCTIKKYIADNKQRPSESNNDISIKKMGCWITKQHMRYKKKIQIMKDDVIRKDWEYFLREYREYFLDDDEIWDRNFANLKKFIDDNEDVPKNTCKNEYEHSLARWSYNTNTKYIKI